MSIQTKIEAIRRQPEHIRMRYVLGSVFISMLLISILWIFSVTTSFQRQVTVDPTTETQAPPKNSNATETKEAPSLNEWIKK